MHSEKILGDSELVKNRRKRAIRNVKKAQHRKHTFHMLTKQISKGEKNSFKRVKVLDDNNEVQK